MADFAVGDLYDLVAAELESQRVAEDELYKCRFCPDFEIPGKDLISSNSGRSHAAAHRISFDALLDPKLELSCPICEESVGEAAGEAAESAMINDLDLVRHLIEVHDDLLSDELVSDFTEPSYLLTTFIPCSSHPTGSNEASTSSGPANNNIDVNEEVVSDSDDDIPIKIQESSEVPDECTSSLESEESTSTASSLTEDRVNPMSSSRISCALCPWNSSNLQKRAKLKKRLISHIRNHIRLKLASPDNEADSLATERLCCIDFVLEEYSETGELDLTNAQCSELPNAYHGVLLEVFGLCLPLAMRVVHGVEGNPFKAVKVIDVVDIEEDSCSGNDSPGDTSDPTEETAEDLFEVPSVADIPEMVVRCGRSECGHMGIDLSDASAVMRHLAAHIRHDEKRLQMLAKPLVCECGLASYSPQGFMYHEFRDHCFTKKNYNGLAHSIIVYIVLIWDTMFRSCAGPDEIITTLLEGPWSRTNMRNLVPIWGAYLCLEPDEGEEVTFANNTQPGESWLRKWKMFTDKNGGTNKDAYFAKMRIPYHRKRRTQVSHDLVHLLEAHPFVQHIKPPRVKRTVYATFDEKTLQRVFNTCWKQLNIWLARPLLDRQKLAPTPRWNQLYDIRRRVNYKKNKALIRTDGVRNIHWTEKDLAPFQCIPGLVPRQSDYVAPQFYISGKERIEINGRPEQAVDLVLGSVEDVKLEPEDPEMGTLDVQVGEEIHDFVQNYGGDMNGIIPLPDLTLEGQYVTCQTCENYTIPAEDLAKITTHCASHALLESRQLSNLYIHLQSERPLSCLFCLKEFIMYSPIKYMEHIESEHQSLALWLYEKLLKRQFPQSAFFSPPTTERPEAAVDTPSVFVIKCDRASLCGKNEILRLDRDESPHGYDVDKLMLNHMLWHVKNDGSVKVGKSETDLLCRVISTRLVAANTNLSHRLIPIMTRKAIRHWPRLSRKEPDVLKFVLEILNEISWALFGRNKGFVFSMIFPRRWHRDQCGPFLYPLCQCLLCAEVDFPKKSIDRRKRVFVSNVLPVLLHVMDHIDVGDVFEISNVCNTACPMDNMEFSKFSGVIRHILHNHRDVLELNGFKGLLADMGMLETFHELLAAVFGSQAWQLEEALGFHVYEQKKTARPTFFEEMETDYNYLLRDHRADCVRFRDAFAKHCHCGDLIPSSSNSANNKNGSGSLPSEALPFYKEFLETEPLKEAEKRRGSLDEEAKKEKDHPAVKKEEPLDVNIEATTSIPPPEQPSPCPATGSVVDLLNTLMCANILANALGTQALNLPSLPNPLSAADFLAGAVKAEDLLGKRRSTRKKNEQVPKREKRKSTCQEEAPVPSTSTTVDRNSQLPLKNVIQGSKTIAAAVAAALGACEDSKPDQSTTPHFRPVTVPYTSAPNIPTGYLLGKREKSAIGAEESDLALGSMVKRIRVPSTSEAPKKKQRRRRRHNSISLLLSDDC